MPSNPFDVAIIGAGVVGTAVARLLSQYQVSVVLVDSAPDVGAGISKANTAILHTGFDATPGTLESRLVARGYHLLSEYAAQVGIAVETTGAVLVAWDDEQFASLPNLAAKAAANGYERAEIIDSQWVYQLEPHLGPGVAGAMLVPDEHIIDPWSPPVAFTREAIANGATWIPNQRVSSAHIGTEATELVMANGTTLQARYVVNAAGLGSDDIHRLFGLDGFTIQPRRGELVVFDKLSRPLLHRTILPVPTSHTKGVLVAPTVFGNIMLGPTADDIDDKTATGSTRLGLDSLLAKGRRILPHLIDEEVTAVYAGLRAATEHADYQLSANPQLRYVCLGGIRSTGLTSAMAVAEEAVTMLDQMGCSPAKRDTDSLQTVHMSNLGEVFPRPYQSGGFGAIVCHCERVTHDEIAAACTQQPPATTLDGIRRRTRALAGRCQGFYCTAEVCAVAAQATNTTMNAWAGMP